MSVSIIKKANGNVSFPLTTSRGRMYRIELLPDGAGVHTVKDRYSYLLCGCGHRNPYRPTLKPPYDADALEAIEGARQLFQENETWCRKLTRSRIR